MSRVSTPSFLLLGIVLVSWPTFVTADPPAVVVDTSPAAEQGTETKKSATTSWPLFRGDSHSTGIAKGTFPDDPQLLWKFSPGKESGFTNTAAIANGHVFVGDWDGTLYSINVANGEKKWQLKTEIGFSAPPAYRDGRLFIGDIDGIFYCVDAEKGELLWKHDAGTEIGSGANFYEGRVIFGASDGTLYGLEVADGAVAWKFEIPQPILCSPTVVDDRAFVAGCDAKLHIVDLKNGKSTGTVDIEGPTGVTPAVRGDYVYFGTEGGVFYAVNWKEQEIEWEQQPGDRVSAFRSSPAVTKTMAVVGCRGKRVFGIQLADGETKWQFVTKRNVDSSPVIVGNRAIVGSDEGRLYMLDVESGDKVWEYELGGTLGASPAFADGKLVIGSDDGTVYCFGKAR